VTLAGPAQLVQYLGRAPELVAARRHTPALAPLVLRYLEIGRQEYPFQLRLTSGATLTFSSPAEVKVFWQIFVRRCYRLPERCRTILDCGANVGIFSVWAAQERPAARIVALEPFAETYKALETHIRTNGLERRVTCVQAGLAGATGERWMEAGSDSPRRKMVAADVAAPAGEAVPIRCITLGEALEQFDLQTLDVLKMVIEGSEWEVLLSTAPETLAGIRHIQLEYHRIHKRFGYTPEKLFAHLGKAGHRLVWKTEDAHHTGLAYFERSA
jgi:FkbM family methyltransferase